MAQVPAPRPRAILEYEENWEESLTSLGPGPSHWLFTGGHSVLPIQPEAGPATHHSAKMSGHIDGATMVAESFSQHTPMLESPTDDTASISGDCGRPGLSRELSRASASVDSLQTCPSLRASSSQLSLASWTSFDALDPDPFHADVDVFVVTPDGDEDRSQLPLSVELAHEQRTFDASTFKQLSRHHFALHQHPQLASRLFSKPRQAFAPRLEPSVASSPRRETPREQLRPTIRPRHPLLGPTTGKPVVSCSAVTTPSFSSLEVHAAIVPRPHVATQPATLATSLAAWSMRSFLEAVGDAGSSAAVRSLRRVMRLGDEADTTPPQSKPARKSRSALPHDWVMV